MKTLSSILGATLMCATWLAHASSIPSSDRLIVGLNGATVFDQTIAEASVELPLVFGPPIVFPDDLLLTTHVVLVLEPPGEAVDPNADVLTVPNPNDPNRPFVVSDAIARIGVPGTDNFRILFGSDGDPFLRPAFEILSSLHPTLSIIFETGELQNVTDLLGLTDSGYSVEFRSDVPVPLPGTLWFGAVPMFALAALRRRQVVYQQINQAA